MAESSDSGGDGGSCSGVGSSQGTSHEMEEVKAKHAEICSQLALGVEETASSWDAYSRIEHTYTLDGDQFHWMACPLYIECQKSKNTPAEKNGKSAEGNSASLIKLLTLCNIRLSEFFLKIKKWMEMATDISPMSDELKKKIERLQSNFAVSALLFQKFQSIYNDVFIPADLEAKSNKKSKLTTCNHNNLYEFSWNLFICVKGEYPSLSNDLVHMFHILLSCIDFVFANAFMLPSRKDLINPKFEGLPSNWTSAKVKFAEAPCIIEFLCRKYQGLTVDAKSIKQYNWKGTVKNFMTKGLLKGDVANLTGVLNINDYHFNLKSLNRIYGTYMLNAGEFDERIFLSNYADAIGIDIKTTDELAKTIAKTNSTLDTPLSSRRLFKNRSEILTPVSQTNQSVAKLLNFLSGCTNSPSLDLSSLFQLCKNDVGGLIVNKQKEMGAKFLLVYASQYSEDLAGNRLNLAEVLFYRLLEHIIKDEQRRKGRINIQALLEYEMFAETLFACSIEIVIHAYGAPNARFPWILDCFQLAAFNFYKIIELVVLATINKLSRDVVKHLKYIEEQVLETLAWESESPVWAKIKNLGLPIPPWNNVCISENNNVNGTSQPNNALENQIQNRRNQTITVPQSPGASPSERFLSPLQGQLFIDPIRPGQSLLSNQNIIPSIENTDSTNDQPAPEIRKKQARVGSLGLFFRKFYTLAVIRMKDLCDKLRLEDEEMKKKVWTCFEHVIINHTNLMRDRHLDQILMCTVYVICRVSNSDENKVERTFTEIMRYYRQQPQSTNNIYRSVLLNNENRDPEKRGNEERVDLIVFYNTVYVPCIQQFALRFKSEQRTECPLNPLPMPPTGVNGSIALAAHRVSEHHRLYVRSCTAAEPATNAQTQLVYRFGRSPAIDLNEINSLISQEKPWGKRRQLLVNEEPTRKKLVLESADENEGDTNGKA